MLRLGGLFVAFRSAKKCLFSVCDPALFRGAKGDNARDLTLEGSVVRDRGTCSKTNVFHYAVAFATLASKTARTRWWPVSRFAPRNSAGSGCRLRQSVDALSRGVKNRRALSRSERRLSDIPPVEILSGSQISFFRIVDDVLPQVVVLFRAANKMVEGFLLPEFALPAEMPIDLSRCVMQP